MNFSNVFPSLFSRMKRSFFEDRKKKVEKILNHMIDYFDDKRSGLSAGDIDAVETTLKNMAERYGYDEESAREAVAFLQSNRYKN